MDVVEHAKVDTHTIIHGEGFDWWFLRFFDFDAERRVPRASGFFLHRDFFDVSIVEDVAVEADWHPPDFREVQQSTSLPATLMIEFKTGLVVRETAELSRLLPVQRANVVPFLCEFPEVVDVSSDALDVGLQDF